MKIITMEHFLGNSVHSQVFLYAALAKYVAYLGL